jgi:hypothetical protein
MIALRLMANELAEMLASQLAIGGLTGDNDDNDDNGDANFIEAQTHSMDEYEPNFHPANVQVMNQFVTISSKWDPKSQCSICLDNDEQTTGNVRSPCGHLFHHDCLQEWLTHGDFCPVCRRQWS